MTSDEWPTLTPREVDAILKAQAEHDRRLLRAHAQLDDLSVARLSATLANLHAPRKGNPWAPAEFMLERPAQSTDKTPDPDDLQAKARRVFEQLGGGPRGAGSKPTPG